MILWRILADRFRWIPLCWMIMSIAPWRMLTIKMTDSLSNTKRMCRVHLCHVTGEWLPNRISNLVRWKTMHTKRKSKKLLPSALRNLKPHTDDLDALLTVCIPNRLNYPKMDLKLLLTDEGNPFFYLFIYMTFARDWQSQNAFCALNWMYWNEPNPAYIALTELKKAETSYCRALK